ncbi:2-hydroxyacid dehydrogenase [Arthrobacter koreensis]|uniref:2-hydroxyacid dehydrogenase n=1 Tax=Arthrobacter koreensis TaxID=199136 RepID=UPI00363F2ABB
MSRILIAGDHFVLNSLLREALSRHAPDLHEPAELTLPWPVEPFHRIAEVDEASGDEDQLIDALQGAEICLTQMAPLTERVLRACPELRLFAVTRGGPVNANLAAAAAHGVAVTFAPGRNATATAEHTVGLTLAAVRQIPQRNAELLAGAWRSDYYRYNEVGPEISGATVGLIGYGAIGSRVAAILHGFGARILVFDPFIEPGTLPPEIEQASTLDELLGSADIVTLHARLTPETTGLIGARELALMRPGSILINAARGALLDYDALCDALEAGHLYGTGLDVYPSEPLPVGSRLRSIPSAVLTPHLAGASKPTAHKAAEIGAAEVGRYLRGEPLQHCANPEFAHSKVS